MMTNTNTTHPFETSGCGVAPFRAVGFRKMTFQAAPGEPIKAGGMCDHCGTAIMNAYVIREAGGNTFVVGSSCVDKTGDADLADGKAKVDRKRRAAEKVAKQRAEVAALLTELGEVLWAYPEILDAPLNDVTFRDWFDHGSDRRMFAELPRTRDKRFVAIRLEMAHCQIYKLETGNDYVWVPRKSGDRARQDARKAYRGARLGER